MLDANWFNGKRVTLMGLGLNQGGLGAAKWLMAHGAILTVTDLKTGRELAPSVQALRRECERLRAAGKKVHRPVWRLGRHEARDFVAADMIIKNPGVRRDDKFLALAAKRGVPVETDVSLFFQMCPVPIVGVTGTKGKTTTATLLGEICRRHDRRTVVGGNLCVSVLAGLDRLLRASVTKPPPVVLELSSWQLEGLRPHRLSPHVSVVTNIKEDHLNTYRGLADYVRAKETIIAFQRTGDTAVLNYDDPRVRAMGERVGRRRGAKPRVTWFSERPLAGRRTGCGIFNGWIVRFDSGRRERILPLKDIRLPGQHNVSNVLAAVTAALALGVSKRVIAAAVRLFRGVPNRLETVATKAGVRYVNDTTATTS